MITFEEHQADGEAIRIELNGRLDSAGVEQIEAPLTSAIRAGTFHVLFDLAHVAFVGSLGIRLLIASARALQKQGRQVVIFGVQPQVADVFETVALSDLIPTAATEAEAIGLLAA